jgi:hypothetical protein
MLWRAIVAIAGRTVASRYDELMVLHKNNPQCGPLRADLIPLSRYNTMTQRRVKLQFYVRFGELDFVELGGAGTLCFSIILNIIHVFSILNSNTGMMVL